MDPISAVAAPAVVGPTRPIDLRAPAAAGMSANERAVAEALLACMGRWGLSKTTMDDIASEAGLSRATVYRLFPGGKSAILVAAATEQVRELVATLSAELADAADLEECLVGAVHISACFLDTHEALAFMREHEPVALDRLMSFDRLELLFATSGHLLAPVIAPYIDDDPADGGLTATEVAVWLTRLVVSHLSHPATSTDLTRRADVTELIRTYVLPGVSATAVA